jgi:hypothetical protein
MQIAKSFYKQQDYRNAFQHLERAHILGQRYALPHTVSHCWMMKVGWRQHDWREVSGQVPRILASLLISKIWVPRGNTGGANVSPLKAMPVPEDLQELLKI